MKLDTLAGNDALKRQLSAQAAGRGLSHAYLISGPKGSGKRTLADLLAAAMVCTGAGEKPCGTCSGCKKAREGIHPDIMVVGADGKDIPVSQARIIRSDAYIRPNEAPRKVYIIENAQNLNIPAQNALLKLLEEGPAYAAFLLLTDNPGAVLETVRSRCESLTLAPPASDPAGEEEIVTAAGELLERMAARDELALAAWCVGREKWDRDKLVLLLEREVALLRDALVLQAGAPVPEPGASVRQAAASLTRRELADCAAHLEALRRAADYNAGVGALCGALCAGIGRILCVNNGRKTLP